MLTISRIQEDVRNLRKGQTWKDWKQALQYFMPGVYAEHKASLHKFFLDCDFDAVGLGGPVCLPQP